MTLSNNRALAMDMELNRRAPDLDCIEKTANNIHCICKYQNGTFQVKIAKFM